VLLVVAHHLALVYGAFAPFYYQEPPFTDPPAFRVLAFFVLTNQAWFMGALFLLAGYFTPGSFDRKGAAGFLKNRSLRLGVPVLAAIFLLDPVARIGLFLMPSELTGITAPLTFAAYPKLLGLGPLWFALMLLIFSFLYALWRRLTGAGAPRAQTRTGFPGMAWALAFSVALAWASYLFRIAVPIGKEVTLFLPFLDFPTIAYLPQYAGLFVLGVAASRRDWLSGLTGNAGLIALVLALAAWALLFPLAISSEMFVLRFSRPPEFPGGGHWQSAAYALWDSTLAVCLPLAAITAFRRFVGGGGRIARFLSGNSYAVYVIHSPVIVFICYAMRGIDLPALAKFALAAIIVIPVCFAVAHAIRKLPGVRMVL
jgi:hypothetical protein